MKQYELTTINGKNRWVHCLYEDGTLLSEYQQIKTFKGGIITNTLRSKEKQLTAKQMANFEAKNINFLT